MCGQPGIKDLLALPLSPRRCSVFRAIAKTRVKDAGLRRLLGISPASRHRKRSDTRELNRRVVYPIAPCWQRPSMASILLTTQCQHEPEFSKRFTTPGRAPSEVISMSSNSMKRDHAGVSPQTARGHDYERQYVFHVRQSGQSGATDVGP
jgi:hypothetical protein